jgi:hypothetical protein
VSARHSPRRWCCSSTGVPGASGRADERAETRALYHRRPLPPRQRQRPPILVRKLISHPITKLISHTLLDNRGLYLLTISQREPIP